MQTGRATNDRLVMASRTIKTVSATCFFCKPEEDRCPLQTLHWTLWSTSLVTNRKSSTTSQVCANVHVVFLSSNRSLLLGQLSTNFEINHSELFLQQTLYLTDRINANCTNYEDLPKCPECTEIDQVIIDSW